MLFVYVLTAVPPQFSDPCNFVAVLLVARGPGQTTLLFWGAACGVAPHGLHTADRRWPPVRHFQICFLPWYFDRLFVYMLFVRLVLFVHWAMCGIIWHLGVFVQCFCLDAGLGLVGGRCLAGSILFVAVICMARSLFGASEWW